MKTIVLLGSLLLVAAPLAAADAHPGCNQLGREIALRAAERMQVGLDAAARAELALIARDACVEFAAPVLAGGESAAAAASPDEGAAEEPRRVFGLEIIPPGERVRRPGLKRP